MVYTIHVWWNWRLSTIGFTRNTLCLVVLRVCSILLRGCPSWPWNEPTIIHGDPVQAALRAVLFLGGGSGQRESSAHESLEVWKERPGAGQRKEIPRDSNPPLTNQAPRVPSFHDQWTSCPLVPYCLLLGMAMNHAMPTQVGVWLGWHIYWIVTQLAPGKLNENRNLMWT